MNLIELIFLCNILRKKRVMKLIFWIQISMKACCKIILWFWFGYSSIPKFPKIASLQCLYNISKKKLDEVYFLHVDKYQSLLQVDFNTLDIKVSNKAIRSLLMDMIKHSQSTRSNKFAISLQDVEKDVRNGANFLYTDKHQSLYKLALYFLMKVTKHVKSTQNRKLVIFLQYVKKKVLQLLLCSIVMQKIQIFYGSSVTFVVSFF